MTTQKSPMATSSPGSSPLSRWQVGVKKTLAKSRSRVSKNIGDFDCFKMASGSRLANFVVTWPALRQGLLRALESGEDSGDEVAPMVAKPECNISLLSLFYGSLNNSNYQICFQKIKNHVFSENRGLITNLIKHFIVRHSTSKT